MRFEPEGITRNPEIPFAKSLPDYIMRWLGSRFIDDDAVLEDLGILTAEIRAKREAQQALPIAEEGPAPTNGGNGHSEGNGSPTGSNGETKPAATALTDTPPVVPAKMSPAGDLG